MSDLTSTIIIGVLCWALGGMIGIDMGLDMALDKVEQGEVTIQVDHAPDIIYTCEIRGNSDD